MLLLNTYPGYIKTNIPPYNENIVIKSKIQIFAFLVLYVAK